MNVDAMGIGVKIERELLWWRRLCGRGKGMRNDC